METVIGYSGIKNQIEALIRKIVDETTKEEMEKALDGVQDKINNAVADRASKMVCRILEGRSAYAMRPEIIIHIQELDKP